MNVPATGRIYVRVVYIRVGRMYQPRAVTRKVDVRLPGKRDSNSHGARPVHQKHR